MNTYLFYKITLPIVRCYVSAHALKEMEVDIFRMYSFIYLIYLVLYTYIFGFIIFIIVNLGVHINRITVSVIVIGLCHLLSYFNYRIAKKKNVVKYQMELVKEYTKEELKKYIKKIIFKLVLPITFSPIITLTIAWLLQTFVFHR